jgi:hypothetical protein
VSQPTVVVPAKGATYENPKSFFEFETDALMRDQVLNFEVGQAVCLLVVMDSTGDGTPMLLDSVEHDTNQFVIVNINQGVAMQLATSRGYLYAATFVIKDELGSADCCGRRFVIDEVTLAPLPRNPSKQEVKAMPEGTTFVVEGVYLHYLAREKSFGESVPAGWWVIKTETGYLRIDTIKGQRSDKLQGGKIHDARGTKPFKGETIRLLVTKDSKRGGMTCYRRRPTLICPSQERRREYTKARDWIKHLIGYATTDIQTQDWKDARRHLANVRRLSATHKELQTVEELRMQIPEEQRPLWDDVQAITVAKFIEAYGVNIEAMHPDEQVNFARKLFRGALPRIDNGPSPFDLLYIVRQMDRGTQASLFAEVISTGVERLRGLEAGSELLSNREFLFECCLNQATHYNHDGLAEAIATFIEGCLLVGGYSRQGPPYKHSPLHLPLCQALEAITHYKRHKLHCADGITIDRLASWARQLCDGDAKSNLRSDVNAIMRIMCS